MHEESADICPGAPTNGANHVDVAITGGYLIRLTHVQHVAVLVEPGQTVKSGDAVGLVGNSGLTHWPHLHTTLNWRGRDAPYNGTNGGSWSVPSSFRSIYVKDAGSASALPASVAMDAVPLRGQFVSNEPFSEMVDVSPRGCGP
jgi:murein DD-endopeptidase MepM/ murein hydrolase activator NlpD